jgi:hypothetical protein
VTYSIVRLTRVGDPVQRTDLDVIVRHSIAVRTLTADRDDLIETRRGDLASLESGEAADPAPEAP